MSVLRFVLNYVLRFVAPPAEERSLFSLEIYVKPDSCYERGKTTESAFLRM